MNKALNYISLGRKAGRIELGEEPVGAAARALKAVLVVVAQDASDHTWRRAKSYVAGTNQQCIKAPVSKDELGLTVGRQSVAIAAFTDPALALAFVQALGDEQYAAVEQALQERTQRANRRRAEEKAHRRNVRMGRKK